MSEIATGKLVIWMRLQAKRITPDGNSTSIMLSAAADRIESQEQKIAYKDAKIATLTEKAEAMENDLINLDMNLTEMTARAEQAEAREKAAIADMKLIVDNVRETHCDETCCFACKYDYNMSINYSGEFNNECPGFDRDDCFEWRGLPQEGEGK